MNGFEDVLSFGVPKSVGLRVFTESNKDVLGGIRLKFGVLCFWVVNIG
jgi:hypothetical protein